MIGIIKKEKYKEIEMKELLEQIEQNMRDILKKFPGYTNLKIELWPKFPPMSQFNIQLWDGEKHLRYRGDNTLSIDFVCKREILFRRF